VAGAYFAGIRPLARRQTVAAQQRSQLDTRRAESRKLQGELDELKDRFAQTRQALSDSPLRLRPGARINAVLARISEQAVECDLKVDKLVPQPPQAGPRFKIVPIQLTGRGTFPNAARFLHRLRKELPDAGVVFLDLRGVRGDPGEAEFQFRIEWYAAP